MKWTAFIQHTAEASGFSQAQVRQVLSAAVTILQDELRAGGSVSLHRLGTLSSRWSGARVIRDIQTGRKMRLDGRFRVHFRSSPTLQKILLGRSPQRWKSPDHQLAWRLSETLISDLAMYHFNQAPTDLTASMTSAEIHARCQQAFGETWTHIAETYTSRISETIRQEHDYLAEAVLRQWPAESL